jgi:hypothetical protein
MQPIEKAWLRGILPGSVAGVSVYSAAVKKIFLGSNAMVLALGCVLTAPVSLYSSADFWW